MMSLAYSPVVAIGSFADVLWLLCCVTVWLNCCEMQIGGDFTNSDGRCPKVRLKQSEQQCLLNISLYSMSKCVLM